MLAENDHSDIPFVEVTAWIDINLDRKNENLWEKLANKTYYGSDSIPLSVPSSEIPQVLKDAHWHIHAGKKVEIGLKLYADGYMKIVPIVTN